MAPTSSTLGITFIVCQWIAPLGDVGFCLNEVPQILDYTGFTAVSALSKNACLSEGHEWCPLDGRTDSYTVDGVSVEYYIMSACCTGEQGKHLIVDTTSALPTCKEGKRALACTRIEWQDKLVHDLIGEGSGYNFQTPASSLTEMDPWILGGNSVATCMCSVNDPNCTRKDSNGTTCLVCETSQKCSEDAVEFGINFFKIHTLDLKSSALSISAWVRQEWYDRRLSYDYQCFGGLEYIDVIAEAGSLENSRIWTPDIELYNSEEPIWQGSLPARLATVWACWDQKPSRGGCGKVFWSRPGLLKALCQFDGLLDFPYDVLSCELEFASWSLDGRVQDVLPRAKDGGMTWVDDANATQMAGLTAGSKWQDYRITGISAKRAVVVYDCCPNSPYPTLLYTVKVERARIFYILRLMLPTICVTIFSFVAFFMEPNIGERLGYGMIIILAHVTNDAYADMYMPIANRLVYIDYVTLLSKLYALIALMETAVVLTIYHHKEESVLEAIVPTWMQNTFCSRQKRRRFERRAEKRVQDVKPAEPENEYLHRRRLWQKAFYALDRDHTRSLSPAELKHFTQLLLEHAYVEDPDACLQRLPSRRKLNEALRSSQNIMSTTAHDDMEDLSMEDFIRFCEENLATKVKGAKTLSNEETQLQKLEFVTHTFCEESQTKDLYIEGSWQRHALDVDRFARFVIPPIYLVSLTYIITRSSEDLEAFSHDGGLQTMFFASGVMFLIVSLVVNELTRLFFKRSRRTSRGPDLNHLNAGNGAHSDDVEVGVRQEQPSSPPCSKRPPSPPDHSNWMQPPPPVASPSSVAAHHHAPEGSLGLLKSHPVELACGSVQANDHNYGIPRKRLPPLSSGDDKTVPPCWVNTDQPLSRHGAEPPTYVA